MLEGRVYGRKVRLAKVFAHTPIIRVLFLEESDRYRLLERVFEPFEDNVPRSAWLGPKLPEKNNDKGT